MILRTYTFMLPPRFKSALGNNLAIFFKIAKWKKSTGPRLVDSIFTPDFSRRSDPLSLAYKQTNGGVNPIATKVRTISRRSNGIGLNKKGFVRGQSRERSADETHRGGP